MSRPGVTVILPVWKRDYLAQQLPAIFGQTLVPDQVILWQCLDHVSLSTYYMGEYRDRLSVVHSDHDFGFHSRFLVAGLAQTTHVALFDDDAIPGRTWLQDAARLSDCRGCVVGSSGRSISNGPIEADGTADRQCAFVIHAYFLRREWLSYFLALEPYTWGGEEDIHLGAACSILGDVASWVLASGLGAGAVDHGADQHASWRRTGHDERRAAALEYYKQMGWVAP
jgi:hypothetical protein